MADRGRSDRIVQDRCPVPDPAVGAILESVRLEMPSVVGFLHPSLYPYSHGPSSKAVKIA